MDETQKQRARDYQNCNRGIGHLQESEEIMTNAIAYLQRTIP